MSLQQFVFELKDRVKLRVPDGRGLPQPGIVVALTVDTEANRTFASVVWAQGTNHQRRTIELESNLLRA